MSKLCARLAFLLPGVFVATTIATAAPEPFALLYSLFDPNTNVQANTRQGYSVAMDGNIAIIGAPYDAASGVQSGVARVYDVTTGLLLHTLANPTPEDFDQFGWSVAISGTRVVVGADQDNTGAPAAGSAYVFDLSGPAPALPVLTLNNPGPALNDHFGSAVAISGARVVVGTPYDVSGTTAGGSVYVYDLSNATPAVPATTLRNPSGFSGDNFGESVAISETHVVVGAPRDDSEGFDPGRVYAYDLASATPTVPLVILTNPSPAMGDLFGQSLAISGSRVVVGTHYDDTGAPDAGSVYCYDLAGATPAVPVLTLTNPSPANFDNFGFSVAISGRRVLVGAARDDAGAHDAGSAYLFDLADATPTVPLFTLGNPSAAAGDQFGWSVALSGERLVIGAPFDNIGAEDAGGAYAYHLASTTPTVPIAVLNEPRPVPADLYGLSVVIAGARVVVGAPYDDTGAADTGRAYVYDLAGTPPRVPVLTLTNPAPAGYDHFGYSVALSGNRVVVGLPHDDAGSDNAGSVYVYDLANPSPTEPVAMLNNPAPQPGEWFGWSVAASGTRVVVGVPYDDTGAQDAGIAYVYDLAGATPTVPVVTLTNPSPALGDAFGWSVAISGPRVVVGAVFGDMGTVNAGGAYVYDLSSAMPILSVVTLTNPSPAVNDQFGSAVAISGPRVVIGAWGDDVDGVNLGSAYVYDMSGATPTVPRVTLTNPNSSGNDHFGLAVAISGTRVVIGADEDSTGASHAGRANVYDLASATPTVPIATVINPSPGLADKFGNAVAVDGATIVAGAPFDDTAAADRGAVYVFGAVPRLQIVPAAPGFATISWTPTGSPGFELHYSDSFAPATWFRAPSGATNPVTVPAANGSRFYQLRSP